MFNPAEKTILVVDDEVDLREAIAFDLKRRGFKVLQAGSGSEALSLTEKEAVNLVISDVRMPGGNGAELLGRLKEKNSFGPALMFITGFTDMRPEDAYHLGAEAVFSKPFDRQALLAAVMKALEPPETRWARGDIRLDIPAAVGVKFPASGIEAQSTVQNFGRGGMFVVLTDNFPQEHEQVEFRLQLPCQPPIEVKGFGTVRWVRRTATEELPSGCGIEFERLDSDGLQRFFALVHEVKMKAYIPKR